MSIALLFVRRMTLVVALTVAANTASPEETDSKLRGDARESFGVLKAPDAARLESPDVLLGRALFWDARLSGNGKTACASCHLPEDWGADRRPFSVDAKGKNTARNSQTVFNAALLPSLRWTGDRKSAAHQAEKSLTGSMGLATAEAIVPMLKEFGYESRFRQAFPKDESPVSPANYAAAIQAYELTLATPAPFDKYLSGDDAALNQRAKRGLELFASIGCADCHSGTLLGGKSLKKFGVEKDYWLATKSKQQDAGLFETTKKDEDRYLFRVSILRNVAKTGPYFHDGSVPDLKEAVQVMADVQLGDRLSDADAESVVAFLETLTGEIPRHYAAPSATK